MVPLLAAMLACTSGETSPGDAGDAATGSDAGPTVDADPAAPDAATSSLRDRARELATHLCGAGNFLIGLGNDNSGPYDHDITIDLHYAYLVGYGDDGGGWPNWNTGGAYVDNFAASADAHGVTPMFTYYQLALELENGNYGVFTDGARMRQYLLDYRLLYQRLAAFDKPAVVTIEPDFFGYLENRVRETDTAASAMPATLHFADVHDCDDLPETVAGLTRCLVAMARAIAPKVRVGFHASQWGAWYDATDPDADVAGAAAEVGGFLLSVGAAGSDFVTVETLDRDAGFWETSGGGASCSVTEGSRGAVYWDESNSTLPNFARHLTWVAALTAAVDRPALWWQTPLGVPAADCGGTADHWRDNRVHYFFAHVDELVGAGGFGASFGTGAGGQTTVSSDGDQFKSAAAAYDLAPFTL